MDDRSETSAVPETPPPAVIPIPTQLRVGMPNGGQALSKPVGICPGCQAWFPADQIGHVCDKCHRVIVRAGKKV